MTRRNYALVPVLLAAFLSGCEPEKKYSTTEGSTVFECDEAVLPVMKLVAEDFQRSYEKARVGLRSVEGRVAVADFAADSMRHIVIARELNSEERAALKGGKIELQEYNIALDAIAVIGHRDNPLKELRMGQLDSIFAGEVTHWPGKRGGAPIDIAIADINSSTNEVFRNLVLGGRPITQSATPFSSSEKLVDYVATHRDAIGIVGLSWLRGKEQDLRVFNLDNPKIPPDSTQHAGTFYAPVQAHIYRKYYPLTRPIYIYNREVLFDVGYGFISYVTSATGQKVFLNNGLVPATMPIRLVEITSHEVK